MTQINIDRRYEDYKVITKAFLDRQIPHGRRIVLLKNAGITGAENIDFDNRFAEENLGENTTFSPNEADLTDFDGESQ